MAPQSQTVARLTSPDRYLVGEDFGAELLEREVCDFTENASVAQAAKALAAHRVHAVLVVGARNGTPRASECNPPHSPATRSPLRALAEGVLIDFDLAVAARR